MSTVVTHKKNAYKNHFIERLRAALLRGGRMTKVKGRAASYAPDLGVSNAGASQPAFFERAANIAGTSVSARALAIVMVAVTPMALTVSGAQAGVCTETFAGSGIFVCSGAAAGGDVTQTPTPPAGGALDVSTVADFGITTAAGNAITMINAGGDTDITFTDNNTSVITGNVNGLYAINNGTGLISITTTGAVTGTTSVGILAYNNTGTSLAINAQGAVTGNLFGVYGGNFGTGALSITTQAVTASVFSGIQAVNSAAGTSLTVNAQGTVNGGNRGISAQNNGSGALSITSQAVTSATGNGFFVNNSAAGTSLTINAQGAVQGNSNGIYARNLGTGAMSVTTQAVTGATGSGIFASNNNGTSFTIDAQGAVQGDIYGIYANNLGTGAVLITTQAVTGTISRGIFAINNNVAGTNLTINAQGAVLGGNQGIYVRNAGTGAVSITTQAVTGTTGRGIFARNLNGTDLTINAQGTVQGGNQGIYASNAGAGAVSITTQAVTGTTDRGIFAFNNNAAATSLTINAQGAVQGGTYGIYARNAGTGAVSINTQTVTGTSAVGIFASNNNGTDLTINAQGAVQGGARGIYARNGGSGAVSITTQAVTGTSNFGISARNFNGTSLTINAQGAVQGGARGIYADNDGSGALSVTSRAVTSTAGYGIFANNSAAGTNLTINAQGAVSGTTGGIFTVNTGSGALSITTQAVTGANTNGIFAVNNAAGTTSLTINAQGTVSGNTYGINANNYGSGAVSITTQAVTGTVGSGIFASNNAAGTSLTINAQGAVSGNTYGIFANNQSAGVTSITTSGGVTGIVGIRVAARANNSPTTITNSSAITGTGGVAINFQGNGNDTLNLIPGSVINGTIDFGNGNDGLGGTNPNDIDRLNVAPGLNTVLTFADTSGGDSALASAPESASSNVAFFNGGTQAVAIDPTGFAASGVFLGTLTTAIFNSIDNNGSGPQGGQPLTGGISPAGGDAKSLAYGSGRRLWVSGFGGKQEVDGNSNTAGIDNRFGGAITGVEIGVGGKGAFGVFGGYAVSSLDIEYNAGDLEVDSAFGGAYWKIDTGKVRIQLAIVAGSANQDTTRNITGGTVARGEADGWFFSPSATLAVPIEGLSFPLIASGRVSYAGLFTDGYTETGVANPLTVGDRDVQVFNTRAQFTLPQTIANKNGSKTRIDWRAGVDAQFDGGSDNVALVVGGTPLSFSANLNDNVAGFLGASLIHTSENGMYSFTASGEVQSAFNGGYKAVGQIRALVNF